MGRLGSYTVVAAARVQVLTFDTVGTPVKLSVDVTIGQTHALLSARLIRNYIRMSKRLQACIYSILHWASAKKWKGAKTGGLSSFSIELMAVFVFIRFLKSYTVTASARVQVLTFEACTFHKRVFVDITLNQHHAAQSARLIRNYVRMSKIYQAVVYALLQWVERKRWKGAKSGGLSSFAVELLATYVFIHAEQVPNLQAVSQDRFVLNPGELPDELEPYIPLPTEDFVAMRTSAMLASFFECFATFNFGQYKVWVKEGRATLKPGGFDNEVFIEDPQTGLNVAKSVTEVAALRHELQEA
ncbi:hypothetical protein HPB52_011400 [Rhipicephalus sanguineus]|uniref:PAP-associated domain-containing protein n=1 Tax=Rhipicephalus sanguineus TaxID=34632 RepID=A0A9D4PFR0_RHISA|nr:hypothetical protein HPB52_011400 [Rhipicephalus sanguineus]